MTDTTTPTAGTTADTEDTRTPVRFTRERAYDALVARIREIADEVVGVQAADADPIALLDEIDRTANASRIDASRAEVSTLRKAIRCLAISDVPDALVITGDARGDDPAIAAAIAAGRRVVVLGSLTMSTRDATAFVEHTHPVVAAAIRATKDNPTLRGAVTEIVDVDGVGAVHVRIESDAHVKDRAARESALAAAEAANAAAVQAELVSLRRDKLRIIEQRAAAEGKRDEAVRARDEATARIATLEDEVRRSTVPTAAIIKLKNIIDPNNARTDLFTGDAVIDAVITRIATLNDALAAATAKRLADATALTEERERLTAAVEEAALLRSGNETLKGDVVRLVCERDAATSAAAEAAAALAFERVTVAELRAKTVAAAVAAVDNSDTAAPTPCVVCGAPCDDVAAGRHAGRWGGVDVTVDVCFACVPYGGSMRVHLGRGTDGVRVTVGHKQPTTTAGGGE